MFAALSGDDEDVGVESAEVFGADRFAGVGDLEAEVGEEQCSDVVLTENEVAAVVHDERECQCLAGELRVVGLGGLELLLELGSSLVGFLLLAQCLADHGEFLLPRGRGDVVVSTDVCDRRRHRRKLVVLALIDERVRSEDQIG